MLTSESFSKVYNVSNVNFYLVNELTTLSEIKF